MLKPKTAWVIALWALLGTGCEYEAYRTTTSEVLTEPATVINCIYTPPTHGSGISPGLDANLDLTLTYTSIDIQPVYGVVFKCKHGQFISQGGDQRHKVLWAKLPIGTEVTVSYKEVYEETVKCEAFSKKERVVGRKLERYDFLDAVPVGGRP
jgi:hypothetical protein